jgi:hypothetical protein
MPIQFNKDIVFLYKFDSRDRNLQYGKIRLSAIPNIADTLVNEIKPIVLDVINNSGQSWQVDYWELDFSIISIIDRDDTTIVIDDQTEQYIYGIYIDVREHDALKYYYKGEPVNIMTNYCT